MRAATAFIITAILGTSHAQAQTPAADPDRIAAITRTLSSDAFEGREPGTRAEEKTIRYLADAFREAGLQPAGEIIDGRRSWYYRVPVLRSTFEGPLTVGVATPKGRSQWQRSREIALMPSLVPQERQTLVDVPLVFVGYGVNAPDRDWNDYKDVDLTGKIAVALANDPDVETDSGRFDGKAVTIYGRSNHKISEAMKRGAVGVLFVHQQHVLGYAWATTSNTAEQHRYALEPTGQPGAAPRIEGWLDEPAVRSLFTDAGLDFDTVRKQAMTPEFSPVPLTGVALSASYQPVVKTIESRHVMAQIPGTRSPDETILIGAHWDHIGVGKPDAKGDRIFNGAWDNAIAVGALVEMGRTLARRPPAGRTQLFVAWTLEEPGLMGSEYYARKPLWPLEKTVAVINMDGLFALGRTREFGNHAHTDTDLNDLLIAAGEAQGRRYRPVFYPEMALSMRSDHWPFAKRGVPPISLAVGEDLVNGGTAVGAPFVRDYLANHYHHQSDNFDPNWRFDGTAQDADMLAEVSDKLARSRQWPEWKDGSSFKAARDASKAQRP